MDRARCRIDGVQLALPLPHVKDVAAGQWPRKAPQYVRRSVAAMSDVELLTTILGTRHEDACRSLSMAYDDFRSLAVAGPLELRQHGCTTGAIERLTAVFEVAKRYGERPWKIGEPLRGSSDVYAHYRERLAAETCEYFYAVLLDNKHRKLRDVLLSKGSLTASIVHPRDVYLPVIHHAAAAVIFLHNHPSGDPTPSKEDIEITRRLREVGELIGVRVLDHIVIGRGRYVSFVDDGYW